MQIIKKLIVFILTVESRLILKKYKPFVIAVTGSVGKTATKDAIFCALKSSGHVRKSDKSMNSEIGLPLTIIGVPNAWKSMSGWISNIQAGAKLILSKAVYPEVLILEIGADHPNDIKKVVTWLRPDIAIITKVGDKPVHVEFFDSPAQVFEEKSALARAIKPGGTAVLFADEPKIVALGEELKTKGIIVETFGAAENSTVRGSKYTPSYEMVGSAKVPTGFTFELTVGLETKIIAVKNVVGQTFMYPLLAAVAVAQVRKIDLGVAIENIHSYEAPKGRMNIIAGKNGTTLIDDTYNSSPDAVFAALNTLHGLDCAGKKIAVLGDMMELGQYSSDEHRGVGKKVYGIADVLIAVGPRTKTLVEEALASGMKPESVRWYSSSVEAGEGLQSMISSGDIILIKGSQSPRLERVTKALMADPSQAETLLVRQEKEWLEKK
ncbi:MAG TPA: UDP-N-acetylmuramoyl-tripeptide--D-alanyl-D-alanine ligase [Candidatus Paceibacterota bacterium]|jgi:UDP-N-acetylmuramyl pentapeptide synthase|nr:UDP-N-acetylmuramoyl-tripeptide--D-alanyl-D-alanine ligase [Candidatus Paceibacterota bacterium]